MEMPLADMKLTSIDDGCSLCVVRSSFFFSFSPSCCALTMSAKSDPRSSSSSASPEVPVGAGIALFAVGVSLLHSLYHVGCWLVHDKRNAPKLYQGQTTWVGKPQGLGAVVCPITGDVVATQCGLWLNGKLVQRCAVPFSEVSGASARRVKQCQLSIECTDLRAPARVTVVSLTRMCPVVCAFASSRCRVVVSQRRSIQWST